MLNERESIIAISTVYTLSSIKAHKLLSYYGSAQALWYSRPNCWPNLGITLKVKQQFMMAQNNFNLDLYREQLDKIQVTVITQQEERYPMRLKNIYDPPLALYVRGRLPLENHVFVAVVGSRKRTRYGQSVINSIIPPLVNAKVVIVSGMAAGIDGDAHRATLEHGGFTVAVLGNGIDIAYPAAHAKLMHTIIERGAVISEYPPGVRGRQWTFPARNRIIAGLSDGVMVVEAGEKSGALITADFALEQGIDVFAIPGSIHSQVSVGTHKLIQQGAYLVTEAQDMLTHFGIIQQREKQDEDEMAPFDSLTKRIFAEVSTEPLHIDDIVETVGLPVQQTAAALMMLCLHGLVKEYPGKFFARAVKS